MDRDVDLIFRENMDIMDNETRHILVSVNEADQNQILGSLCMKLYEKITDKVDDIDFGDIPNTKGDITKLTNYANLVDSIKLLSDILKTYKESDDTIGVVSKALENVKSKRDLFEKGFRYNIELPMVVYSTITLSIISSVSFLITSCVEYIKMPTKDAFEAVVDRVALTKSKENLLFRNLEKFNVACSKGQIDEALSAVIKGNQKNLLGDMPYGYIVGPVALVVLLTCIIPLLKELIFFFYYSRTRVSDYFEAQANMLQMNIYNVESNTELKDAEKKKIVAKQNKVLQLFRNISNKLQVTCKKTELQATKELSKDNQKYKANEIMDSMPDSASSKLF